MFLIYKETKNKEKKDAKNAWNGGNCMLLHKQLAREWCSLLENIKIRTPLLVGYHMGI